MTPRNLLIEAGAGTGKTTRLVKAVMEALLVRVIPLENLVALTFTNKAAGELKERVSLALQDILAAPSVNPLQNRPWWPDDMAAPRLAALQSAARQAQGVLDRANMATIHSFAFSLLKRFPLAAGINPESEIDDKLLRFDELFRREWPAWLATELGETAPREALWLEVLARVSLGDLEEAARTLCDFQAPLEQLPLSDAALAQALAPQQDAARDLAARHAGTLKADLSAQACEAILGAARHEPHEWRSRISADQREAVQSTLGEAPKSWSEADFDRLKCLRQIALNLLQDGDRIVALVSEALKPFVVRFRRLLQDEGCLTHNALLLLSRDLVRDHPAVRQRLKQEIRLLLIDEFQDTDPLQAELLLFLAESSEGRSGAWRDVRLEPGKLFIVGDPKQSIYRFRGADMAAYAEIGDRVLRQGGARETLDVNYRSQAQIIAAVNAAFDRLIQDETHVSPPYIAVAPHHPHNPADWPIQGLELWLATHPGSPQSVEAAQTTEAEAVADWIASHKGRRDVPSAEGKRPLGYRDIALIFRTYAPMDQFIEALRRRDIPFAVESERFFFSTPEVTDMLNLLRTIADPADELSKVGFLKGPLAAVPDGVIWAHKAAGTLDRLEPMPWVLALHERVAHEPLAAILHTVFEDSFLLELAARSYHGDQTVANLLKLRRMLESFSARGEWTLRDLLERLDAFFEDDTLEGENPLADESYDAVRLLTIHKAKGLEFPVVFLPSLHSALQERKGAPLAFDWRTNALGFSVGGGFCNLTKILLEHEGKRRDRAEQQRLLYVAMTRARQRLILSGGIHLKAGRSSTFLNRLVAAWGHELSRLPEGPVPVGSASLDVRHLPPATVDRSTTPARATIPVPRFDPASIAAIWKKRQGAARAILALPAVLAPSHLRAARPEEGDETPAPLAPSETPPGMDAARLGTLLHRILEHWDFAASVQDVAARLDPIASSWVHREGLPADAALVEEARQRVERFIESPAYAELAESEILGREVPFSFIENDRADAALVRGRIDVLYRTKTGQLVIGDYKSGAAQPPEAYRAQAEAYAAAIQRSLGLTAEFRAIPL